VATLMHQHAGYQESTAGRLSDLLKSIAMQPLKTELAQGLQMGVEASGVDRGGTAKVREVAPRLRYAG